MELAALEDPFLADAMEGMEQTMQSHGTEIIHTKLQEISQAVEDKIRPAGGKVRKMLWFRMAAAAVVVIAGGLFVWNSFFKPENASKQPELAVTQKETTPDTVVPPPQATQPAQDEALAYKPATDDLTADKSAATKEVIVSNKGGAGQRSRSNAAAAGKLSPSEEARAMKFNAFSVPAQDAIVLHYDTATPAPIVAAPVDKLALTNQILNKKIELNFKDTLNRQLETEVVQSALAGQAKGLVTTNANPKEAAKLSNVIRGRVFDQFNQPIANAYLQAQSSGIFQNQPSQISSYLTDKDGYFAIPTPIQDTALKVSVGALGYNTRNFQLNNNSQANMLQLQANSDKLEEVVVSAYGTKKTQRSLSRKAGIETGSIAKQNAEPVYGWITYNKYLEDNVRKPADNSAGGEVVVSFSVNRKGELADFTILRSLSEAADKEAIRLIKEGPAWKIRKGKKVTTALTVHF